MSLTGPGLVSLLFVVFSGGILVASLNYVARPMTVAFPILFGAITLVLAVTQFAAETFPRLRPKLAFLERGQSAGVLPVDSETTAPAGEAGGAGSAVQWATIRVYLWILAFVLALPFINYVMLTFLFVLAIVRIEGRMRWGISLLVAMGIVLFVYVQFYVFLGMRMGQFPFG